LAMEKVRDRYWLKVLAATALVVASLAITEPSLFGLSLAVVVCFVLIVVVTCAIFVVAELVPIMNRQTLLRSVLAFLVFWALVRWIAFSEYFDGGTFYIGHRPYILNGTIQVAGYLYILTYATVLTVAFRLIERPTARSA
jgi:phosphotransferase system  glucose/maltose/N-acetylglucosamine-specific IIC component